MEQIRGAPLLERSLAAGRADVDFAASSPSPLQELPFATRSGDVLQTFAQKVMPTMPTASYCCQGLTPWPLSEKELSSEQLNLSAESGQCPQMSFVRKLLCQGQLMCTNSLQQLVNMAVMDTCVGSEPTLISF